MKKDEFKLIVTISVAFSVIIGCIYLLLLKCKFDHIHVFRAISFGLTLTTFFWSFYIIYGWKLPLINLIFYRPNINGTWSGKLVSDWKDENGNVKPPIDFYVVIRQTFLDIHFTTFTKDFIGRSYSENFRLSKETGLKNVVYLYSRDTSQNINGFIQEGGSELRLVESLNSKILEGKYWTNNKTQGTIKVYFLCKEHVDSFYEAENLKNE